MKTQKIKKCMSLFLAALMCVTTLFGIGTTVYAAEETDEVCLVSFPRDGDANYGGEWGHSSHELMNGWSAQKSRYTIVYSMGSYDGNICYCIEPGVPQESGDRFTKKGENFWDNYPSSYNHTISPDDIKPIDNDLIYGEIHGLKKDEDGNALGGAVIGLFKADCTEFTRENAILTATSAEDGGFSFAGVPYGNWIVREIEAPTGFVLSDETFAVTVDKDGAVIEVEIENTLIRGTVQLTKVDKDYPDNKLTGAEFAVYRDSNGNKELDADDELLGTLTETSTGVYEMPDLIYGGYFVKEQKAPEGFYLDENAYYFEITEHGKTVTVENEAGKGFVNSPQIGSLKIIKTSSDNKVEGFSFRVTGPNGYSEIFTTDKNGEILIENLRIGEYVISEVSDGASAAYILPADKTASVFEGAVTKVEMHNELRDTPKTGDDSNHVLWLSLLGISAVGAATLGVIGWKKRRKDGTE